MSTHKTGPFSKCPAAPAPRPDTPTRQVPTDAAVTTTVVGDEETYSAVRLAPVHATEVESEGDPSVHRPSRSPRTPPAAERPGAQPALVLACGNARPVP